MGSEPSRWRLPATTSAQRTGTRPQHRRHGAYSPVDGVNALDVLVDAIHGPVLVELAARGAPFSASSTPA